MQINEKKFKLFFVLAIVLIVVLLTVTAFQITSINQKQKQIAKQKEEITNLTNQLEYYKNFNTQGENGSEIIIPGEE